MKTANLTAAELAELTMQVVEQKTRRDNGDPELTIIGMGAVTDAWVLRSAGGALGWLPRA